MKPLRAWLSVACALVWLQTDVCQAAAAAGKGADVSSTQSDAASKSASAEKKAEASPAASAGTNDEKSEGQRSSEGKANKKMKGHPSTTAFDRAVDPTIVPTPPPSPMAETMSPSPGANHVWVPGHYVPLEKKWTWTPGKWSVPPDPKAIWIQGRYDAETQRWTAGYWQPGDTSGYSAPSPAPAPPPVKE